MTLLLTDDELSARHEELQKIRIHLDEDPLSNGLTGVNAKIAQVQGQKDRVSALLLEAIKNRSLAQILHDTSKGAYERRLYELLVTDADVMAQKTEKLRESMANTRISDLLMKTTYAEIDLVKADAYYKGLYQMYENLESANSNLSRQISVLQMGLEVGEIRREELGTLVHGKTLKIT